MNKVYTFYNSMWQLFWKADGGGNDSDAEAEQLVILSWHAPISPLYIPSKKTKRQKRQELASSNFAALYSFSSCLRHRHIAVLYFIIDWVDDYHINPMTEII